MQQQNWKNHDDYKQIKIQLDFRYEEYCSHTKLINKLTYKEKGLEILAP